MPGISLFSQKPPSKDNTIDQNISQQENGVDPTIDEGDDGMDGGFDADGLLGNDEFGIGGYDGMMMMNDDDDFGFLGGGGGFDNGGEDDVQAEDYDNFNMDYAGGTEEEDESGEQQGGLSNLSMNHQHGQTKSSAGSVGGISLFMNHGSRGKISSPSFLQGPPAGGMEIMDRPVIDSATGNGATTTTTTASLAAPPRTANTFPASPMVMNRVTDTNEANMMQHRTNPLMYQHAVTNTPYRNNSNRNSNNNNVATTAHPTTNKSNMVTPMISPHGRIVLPSPMSEPKHNATATPHQPPALPTTTMVMAPPAPRPSIWGNTPTAATATGAVSVNGVGGLFRNHRRSLADNNNNNAGSVAAVVPPSGQNGYDDSRNNHHHHHNEQALAARNNIEGNSIQANKNAPFHRMEESPPPPKDNTQSGDAFHPEPRQAHHHPQAPTHSLLEPTINNKDNNNSYAPSKLAMTTTERQSFDELFASFDIHYTNVIDKDEAFQREYLDTRLAVGEATAGILKLQAMEMAMTLDVADDLGNIDRLLAQCSQ